MRCGPAGNRCPRRIIRRPVTLREFAVKRVSAVRRWESDLLAAKEDPLRVTSGDGRSPAGLGRDPGGDGSDVGPLEAIFYLLQAHGFETWLVNARDVEHLPGRPKTDKLDAVWLCKVAERQMLRSSFPLPPQIQRLRDVIPLPHRPDQCPGERRRMPSPRGKRRVTRCRQGRTGRSRGQAKCGLDQGV